MQIAKAFIAGLIAVLVFHQGALAVCNAAGLAQHAPFQTAATAPFGVPQFVSLAFWGGAWGVVLTPLTKRLTPGLAYWFGTILLGAVLPSLVAWMLVAPLKGQPLGLGWHPATIATALIVNAAWGYGVALLLRLAGVTSTGRPP